MILKIRPDQFLRAMRMALVLVAVFIVLILSGIPAGLGYGAPALGPMGAFCVVFCWSLSRRGDIQYWLVFAAGIMCDAFYGGPLGIWALSFLVAYLVLRGQRTSLFTMPWLVIGLAYVMISAIAMALAWGLTSLYFGKLIDPYQTSLAFAAGIALFIPISLILGVCPREADTGFG